MKGSLPRLALTLISIALVVWLVIADLGKTNPGEISTPHAQITDLLGRADCEACHGDRPEDMAAACLDCHEEVAQHLQQGIGLHGALEPLRAQACGSCHSDHHGRAFALVSAQSFLAAGVEDRDGYDHRHFDWQLSGKHEELKCIECHEFCELAALEEGQLRYLGLSQDCVACHEDPHEGRMQQGCAECHGQSEAFELVATFEHDERFPLQGVHDEIGCLECHAKESRYSIEAMGGDDPPAWRDCRDCHASPHAEGFLTAAAERSGTSAEDCSSCHGLDGEDFAFAAESFDATAHVDTGFELQPPHDLDCDACHPKGEDFQTRFPGRAADDCLACHHDPHQLQFVDGDQAPEGCASCHHPLHFSPSLFDAERHQRTAFPLTGAHLQAECSACHLDPTADDQLGPIYAEAETRCDACHLGAHDGAFLDRPRGGDCSTCHGTESFSPELPPGFDHAHWTGFPLRGAHLEAECSACHLPLEAPTDQGRRFGFAPELEDPGVDDCAQCHEDPHEGRFDREDLPLEVAGRRSCARCHDEVDFKAVLATDFDHQRWTGYQLQGVHGRIDCADCHQPEQEIVGTSCADCHEDPHLARFDALELPRIVEGRESCERCHNQESFADMRGAGFDHDRWTGFPLVDAHRYADCADCHGRHAAADGGRSLGKVGELFPGDAQRCATCHRNPHGTSFDPPRVARRLHGQEGCARCHNQVSFRVAERDFDHDSMTAYPLDGAHAAVDCSGCHRPLRAGPGERSFAQALGRECESCHRDPHAGQFRESRNSRCANCHSVNGDFRTGLTFQHDTHSRYALDKAHADLACSACHIDYPLRNGGSVVRYRPLGTDCSDCHGLR